MKWIIIGSLLLTQTSAVRLRSDAHMGAAVMMQQSCDDTLVDSLTKLNTETAGCLDAVEKMQGGVSATIDFTGELTELNDGFADIGDTLDSFANGLEQLKFFLSKLPKVGKFVDKAIELLSKVADKISDLAEGIEDLLEAIGDKLEKLQEGLTRVEQHTRSVSKKTTTSLTVLRKLAVCDICKVAELGKVFDAPVSAAATGYRACAALDDFPVPAFPGFNSRVITDVTNAVKKLSDDFERIAEAAKGKAQFALCCDNVLRPINAGLTILVDIFDTATCAADVPLPFDAVMNTLANAVDDLLNVGIGRLNEEIRGFLPDLEIPEFLIPDAVLDETKCLLTEGEPQREDALKIDLGNLLQIPEVNFGDDDAQTLADVGKEIFDGCKEALDDLTDNSDWLCCDAARTCDLKDQIVLYEGNRCTQTIAGTLSHTRRQRINFIRHDHAPKCIANDEARSVEIRGPLKAGVALVLGDNPDNFCTDDNARILLKRDIPSGKTICVDSFERAANTKDFRIFVHTVNGLDGKVSRAIVLPGVSEKDVNSMNTCETWNGGEFGAPCRNDDECKSKVCARDFCTAGKTGDPCGSDNDCSNRRCVNDICRAGVSGDPCGGDSDCSNGRCVKDVCRAGKFGDPCEKDSDCSSNICARNFCRDGRTGDPCGSDDDCKNRLCVKDICRAGVAKDPCEKDSDCTNQRCVKDVCRAGVTGDPCEKDSDCSNQRCVKDVCRAGNRGDPCEKTSDCNSKFCARGSCSERKTGDPCASDTDCLNKRCVKDICRAGAFGDPCEKDTDCSSSICARNSCRDGRTGDPCGSDDDCKNRLCVKDICRAGVTNDPCEKDTDCRNRRCVKDVCRAGRNNDICEKTSDCDSGRCSGGRCKAKSGTGARCGNDNECASNICARNFCRNGRTNEPCGNDNDCLNRRCVKDICRAGRKGDVCEKDSDCNSRDCSGFFSRKCK